jgi:hypothetical protein
VHANTFGAVKKSVVECNANRYHSHYSSRQIQAVVMLSRPGLPMYTREDENNKHDKQERRNCIRGDHRS